MTTKPSRMGSRRGRMFMHERERLRKSSRIAMSIALLMLVGIRVPLPATASMSARISRPTAAYFLPATVTNRPVTGSRLSRGAIIRRTRPSKSEGPRPRDTREC